MDFNTICSAEINNHDDNNMLSSSVITGRLSAQLGRLTEEYSTGKAGGNSGIRRQIVKSCAAIRSHCGTPFFHSPPPVEDACIARDIMLRPHVEAHGQQQLFPHRSLRICCPSSSFPLGVGIKFVNFGRIWLGTDRQNSPIWGPRRHSASCEKQQSVGWRGGGGMDSSVLLRM